jgi:drug/metabolite transporter (DMT)-like permease
MFFGEALCFVAIVLKMIFMRDYKKSENQEMAKAEAKGLQTDISMFWMLIPAACDTLTSTLQLAGLVYVPSSIYQMMRGGVIIVTAILSVCFLKRSLYSHHYFGIFLCFLGISAVGVSGYFASQAEGDAGVSDTPLFV